MIPAEPETLTTEVAGAAGAVVTSAGANALITVRKAMVAYVIFVFLLGGFSALVDTSILALKPRKYKEK